MVCPVIAEGAIGIPDHPITKVVLAAGKEAKILAHLRAPRFEKADQSAHMVVMPVAQDQRVHRGRVDLRSSRLLA